MLVSVLLGASALSASAATEQNPLVVPGRSIGNVSLGMTVAQVRKAIGRPSQVERESLSPSRFLVTYYYEARQLGIVFFGTRASGGRPATKARVTRIETISEGARLDNGIGVGTPERKLRRAFRGRLDCPRWQTNESPTQPVMERASSPRATSDPAISEPEMTVTVFVSRIPPQGYRGFGIITASDIPKALVWQIVVRRAA